MNIWKGLRRLVVLNLIWNLLKLIFGRLLFILKLLLNEKLESFFLKILWYSYGVVLVLFLIVGMESVLKNIVVLKACLMNGVLLLMYRLWFLGIWVKIVLLVLFLFEILVLVSISFMVNFFLMYRVKMWWLVFVCYSW